LNLPGTSSGWLLWPVREKVGPRVQTLLAEPGHWPRASSSRRRHGYWAAAVALEPWIIVTLLRRTILAVLLCSSVLSVFCTGTPTFVGSTSGGGGQTPAFVQKNEVENAQGSQQTSIQVALLGVRASSLLVVACRVSEPGQHISVTSPGATWNEDVFQADPPHGEWTLSIHSAPNVPEGDTTITIHTSPAEFMRCGVMEYSGVATSSHVEATAADGSIAGTMANSGNLTTLGPNRLLVCAVATDTDIGNGLLYIAQDGYTLRLNAPAANDKIQIEDKVAATAGTYNGRMEHSTPDGNIWKAVLVAYKPGS